jgi:hypothetical protein
MSQPTAQFNFLEEYLANVLKDFGLDKLKEEDRSGYLLQFRLQAERRLGTALAPLLTDASADDFARLMDNPDSTPQEWADFWHQAVPNFDAVVKQTLEEFVAEVKKAFGK